MSPGALDQILSGLALPTHPNLLTGIDSCEDAGVYRLNDETALIQTVDFFTPIVDDPFRFGQIAAANALSDVYAMGGKPLLAMNLVCFPSKSMPAAMLQQILAGGLDKLTEAGALLVGGHSIEDSEIKYGVSLTGTVHPRKVLLNSGARPGDQLLLTKPIGVGIIATAIKGGLAGEAEEVRICESMATLNRLACQCLGEVEVHGCTDITGFGLLGHLHEMAAASKVAITLQAAAVPLLAGVLELARQGMIPEGAYNNREYYRRHVQSCLQGDEPLEMVLYDPQTSGGLLVAAPPAAIARIRQALDESHYELAHAVIGEVERDGVAGTIRIV